MLGSPSSLGLVNSGVLLTCAPRFLVICLSDSAGHRRESVSASEGPFLRFLSRLRRPFSPPELPRYPFYRGGSSESYKGMRAVGGWSLGITIPFQSLMVATLVRTALAGHSWVHGVQK